MFFFSGFWSTSSLWDYLVIFVIAVVDIIIIPYSNPFLRPIDNSVLTDVSLNHKYVNEDIVSISFVYFTSICVPIAAVFIFHSFTLFAFKSQHRQSVISNSRNTTKRLQLLFYFMHQFIVTGVMAMILNHFITNLVKDWAGSFRPDFLDRCKYDIFRSACTGDAGLIQEGRRSFFSGHTSTAFVAFGLLSAYLARELELFGSRYDCADEDYIQIEENETIHGNFPTNDLRIPATGSLRVLNLNQPGNLWKFAIVSLPLLYPTYIGISRTQQYAHHPVDVVVGAVVGLGIAFMCLYSLIHNTSKQILRKLTNEI